MTPTLTPAYGRDYKSKKEVLADFNANKDFIFNMIMSPFDGKYCNKRDLEKAFDSVRIRYKKLREIIIVKLK